MFDLSNANSASAQSLLDAVVDVRAGLSITNKAKTKYAVARGGIGSIACGVLVESESSCRTRVSA